jgi:two-component system, cell cycle sensor histidine kinase and response regulator CckA
MKGQSESLGGVICGHDRPLIRFRSFTLDPLLGRGDGPDPVNGDACMDRENLPTFTDTVGSNGLRSLCLGANENTQTIDLNTLFVTDATVSGSFDLRQINHDSFGKLLQALSVPTVLVNRSDEIEFANAAFARMVKGKLDTLGKTFSRLFSDIREAERIKLLLQKVFEQRKPEVREKVVRIHKSKIFARMHFRTMRMGGAQFVLVQIENLTAQKQLASIQKYKKLVNMLPVAIVEFAVPKNFHCSVPSSGLIEAILAARVVDGNNAFARMYRCSRIDELMGVTLSRFFPAKNKSATLYNRWIASGFPACSFETREKIPLQGLRYYENTLLGNVDKGSLIGFWWLKRDISEKKRAEQEMAKAEKLESLGILAGGIAHDFNNLLTGILGNISLAQKHLEEDHKAWKRLEAAAKASLRAQELTRQLLTFSHGGAPIRKTGSISEMLRDSVGFALRGANVRCELFLASDLFPVEMDEAQMSRVLSNLVINGLQAMPTGGTLYVQAINMEIDESHRLPLKPGQYVRIAIRDMGKGIPAENLQKIFDPYFTTKEKGTGLGLATSYSVVKKHDGLMTVKSKLGRGSVFYVYLPASALPLEVKEPADNISLMGSGKLLVMDDEELIRDLARELLNALGYDVELAKDGSEAVTLYREAWHSEKPFDLVIMDLTVPGGMGGQEAIRALRAIDPQVRALVSSGYSDDHVMANFQEHGFIGVLPKPYGIQQVGKLLRQLLNGSVKDALDSR